MSKKEGKMKESQMFRIRKTLESGATITPIEALNRFGCFRLGARIHDLRSEGMEIKTEVVKSKGSYHAKYRLAR